MAKILYVGTAGSDDPTRAGFPFNFALGALEAGHQPEIFLAGEAAYLMKDEIAGAVLPVGMPPLREMLEKTVGQKVPIWV
jgi:predicted peroxiredoxin